MGIFNMGSLQPSPDTWAMGSMTPYDLVLSPRPDDLVMITPHPPMCSGTWYLGASQWACQVCAWRKQALAPSCCGICSPVRDDSHRPSRRSSHGRDFDWRGVWTVRQELTEEKRETLADLPPITDCALALL